MRQGKQRPCLPAQVLIRFIAQIALKQTGALRPIQLFDRLFGRLKVV